MKNRTVDALLFLVDQSFDHKAWHGTGLRGSIRSVTTKQASWRPAQGRHNIRELVLHSAYWKYAVRRLLTGEKRGSFPLKGSNWILVSDDSDAGWRRDVALLVQMHRELRAVVARTDTTALWKKPRGSKYTRLALIEGIASHDLYHAGQIQLLKKLGASKSLR
jgi:uncharacterized damage-inducible protein DinB